LTQYEIDRDILIAYMMMKVRHKDYHGVSDAANDLRVLDAEYINENAPSGIESDEASKSRCVPHQEIGD
jgi:hypothetical protein